MLHFMETLKKIQGGITAVLFFGGMLTSAYLYAEKTASNLATKDDIAIIMAEIAEIKGENRIFQLRNGYTFVEEPVTLGDRNIVIRGQARRTLGGRYCTFDGAIALFEDTRGTPFVGQFVGTGRQLGIRYEPIRSVFALPPELEDGRITVTMQMQYTCAGQVVIENSVPIPFTLMEV